MSVLALATLLALGGNVRADGFYSRGDANCDVTHSAADVVAEVRALGGTSVCSNDDSDRDGTVTAADAVCAAGCLFGPCPIPPSAPHVTAAAPDSAPTIAPFTAIRVTGTNLGAEDGLKRVTIAGEEAVVADVIDANTLEVVVPGDVPPGPAEVVVFNGDLPGFPFTITVAAPGPVGTPDTFDGTLSLVDTLVALMLETDIESAFGDNAAVLREGLQRFRTDLAAQRAALAADPNFTAEVRARLDAAFDGSGVPEMLRQCIAEIEELLVPSAGQGGGAAVPLVGAFAHGTATMAVVRGVAVAATALTLPEAAALVTIGLAVGFVGGLVLTLATNPPTVPILLALVGFSDANGAPRAYPTVGGMVQVEAERFDPSGVGLYVQRFDGHEDRFAPTAQPGDRLLTFALNDSLLCGSTRFRLGQGAGSDAVYSNSVSTRIQPEILRLFPDNAISRGDLLLLEARGLGPWTVGGAGACYARAIFQGRESRESELQIKKGDDPNVAFRTDAYAEVPMVTAGQYTMRLRVEGLDSKEAPSLNILTVTGFKLSCEDTDLEVVPGEPATTLCHAEAVPEGANFPLWSNAQWTTSNDSIVVTPMSKYSVGASVSAQHPGTATITASITIAGHKFSNTIDITVTDETPPAVTLSSDSPNSVKPGDAIVVKVTASDNVGLMGISLTVSGDAVLNPNQGTPCVGEKTCEATYTINLKDKDFTENEITIQADAVDTSLNREESDELTFTIQPQADTTCPQVTIQSPTGGGTVNAGDVVQISVLVTDDRPGDSGVRRVSVNASGEAVGSPPNPADVTLPQPLPKVTRLVTFTVKSAADLAGIADKTITITASASDDAGNTCDPQSTEVMVIGTLDNCEGGISADPSRGYDGDPVTITVAISGDAASLVISVTTTSPGGEFPLQSLGNGVFQVTLYYQGQGPFTQSFTAYDANGTALCSGSIGLTALGPRPGSASGAAGSLRQLPAAVTAGAAQPLP